MEDILARGHVHVALAGGGVRIGIDVNIGCSLAGDADISTVRAGDRFVHRDGPIGHHGNVAGCRKDAVDTADAAYGDIQTQMQ